MMHENMSLQEREAGFTLIELIVVITVISVISIFAAAKFNDGNSKLQYDTILEKITSDVRFAQQMALTEGKGTQVYIDAVNNRYYLKWDDGTYLKNPLGGGNFTVQLGVGDFGAVQITSTAFSGGRLDFQRNGSPLNGGAAFSNQKSLITINQYKQILVTANTGFLKIAKI